MLFHTEDADTILSKKLSPSILSALLLSALGAIHANAEAFGGFESDSFKIKTGGIMLFAMNGLPATPITALAMVTTGTQDGEGTIDYRIFGDPV